MTNTKHRKRIPHRASSRYRPRFDGLEGRLALSDFGVSGAGVTGADPSTVQVGVAGGSETSGSTLTVTSIDPAPGTTTTHKPTSLAVTFDRAIDPFSIGLGDFRLTRLADGNGPATSIDAIDESPDPSDVTGRRVLLTLDGPLTDGQYRLDLSGASSLAGADGATLAGGADQQLGSFGVGEAGPDLGEAFDLGTVAATATVQAGRLDLAANPDATNLYKFTLPAGQPWNLTLDVSAQRDGGTLDASAILYDAQGHPVATADLGHPDAPLDPSLTRSLAGGVYYVAVSGRSTDGGTDGSYRVHLSATPTVASTSVAGISLDRANPYSGQPTGLTIRFSGPIDPASLRLDPSQVLAVVDSLGHSWPMTMNGFSPDHEAASFVFGDALPEGTYRVALAAGSTLADLAGNAPVGQDRLPGILGTIDVEDRSGSTSNDLGTLWASVGASVNDDVTLAPGESMTRTFTLLTSGSQVLVIRGDASQPSISILDRDGHPIVGVLEGNPAEVASGETRWGFVLGAGTYSLSLANLGGETSSVSFSLMVRTTSAASLLDSGLGQGSTTGVTLASPASPQDGGGSATGPTASSGSGPSSVAPQGTGALSTSGASPGEASAASVLVAGLPVGRPSSTFDVIGVVGPSAGSSSFALASSQPGLPNGLLAVPESLTTGRRGGFLGPIGADKSEVLIARPTAATARDRMARESAPSGPRIDATDSRVIADSGWLDRVACWLDGPPASGTTEGLAPAVPAIAPGVPEPGDPETAHRVDLASLTSPAFLVTLALAAYRSRARVRLWARRLVDREAGVRGGPARRFRPDCRSGIGR